MNGLIIVPAIVLFGLVVFVFVHRHSLDDHVGWRLWNKTAWPFEPAPRWIRLYARLRPGFMTNPLARGRSWMDELPETMRAPEDWDPADWNPVSMGRVQADLRAAKRGD